MSDVNIDTLQIKVEAEAKKANSQLDNLTSKLSTLQSTLSGLNTSNLNQLSTGLERFSKSMKSIRSVDTRSFTTLANNINKLNNINTGNMAKLAGSLKNVSSSLSTLSTTNLSGVAELGNAAKAIGKLGSVNVGKAASQMPALATAMQQLSTAVAGLPSLGASATQLAELARAIALLGSAKVTKAMANLPTLGTEMVKLMSTLARAPTVSNNLIQMTNALANLSSQGQKVGTASRSVNSGLKNYSTHARTARTHTLSLASAIGKLYAKYFLVLRALKGLGNAIKSSMDYIEEYNYYNVVMDKIALENKDSWKQMGYDSAESYADSFESRMNELNKQLTGYSSNSDGTLTDTKFKNLGLDVSALLNYEAGLAQVTNSLGMTGEASLATSKAMTMLSADLSSFRNTDLSEVMNNLQSGMIGQSRALYKYGIDITNATLQTYAYKNGISKAVSEMTQAEKMQLRTIAILDQSKVAWTDAARTINGKTFPLVA